MDDVNRNTEGKMERICDKKLWKPLKLETLNVPSATQGGTPIGRIQSPESFNFYKPS
ncbi:hypothetical protein [Parasphingorhabdus sp.]|jgi:hypothetical protein|uniref:hypothetical protein n=1 Tax=Parasphingorhabdus sp. TaxID=2709688 RepID=UPI0039E4D5E1|tara:strand:- start:5258 stop:5428 length:171 start_codon:yes stop_codon:yes gene_type:complete